MTLNRDDEKYQRKKCSRALRVLFERLENNSNHLQTFSFALNIFFSLSCDFSRHIRHSVDIQALLFHEYLKRWNNADVGREWGAFARFIFRAMGGEGRIVERFEKSWKFMENRSLRPWIFAPFSLFFCLLLWVLRTSTTRRQRIATNNDARRLYVFFTRKKRTFVIIFVWLICEEENYYISGWNLKITILFCTMCRDVFMTSERNIRKKIRGGMHTHALLESIWRIKEHRLCAHTSNSSSARKINFSACSLDTRHKLFGAKVLLTFN